jgi:hypothetical protein
MEYFEDARVDKTAPQAMELIANSQRIANVCRL